MVPIFTGLNKTTLNLLASHVREESFTTDDIIFEEGSIGNCIYIIGRGSIDIVKFLNDPREICLSTLKKGEFFGEMSIIEAVKRSASARCSSDNTVIFMLKSIELYHLFKKAPDQYAVLILNIARDISRRLRRVDELYAARAH